MVAKGNRGRRTGRRGLVVWDAMALARQILGVVYANEILRVVTGGMLNLA